MGYCSEHLPLEFLNDLKRKEKKNIAILEKYYYNLKKFVKNHKEILGI